MKKRILSLVAAMLVLFTMTGVSTASAAPYTAGTAGGESPCAASTLIDALRAQTQSASAGQPASVQSIRYSPSIDVSGIPERFQQTVRDLLASYLNAYSFGEQCPTAPATPKPTQQPQATPKPTAQPPQATPKPTAQPPQVTPKPTTQPPQTTPKPTTQPPATNPGNLSFEQRVVQLVNEQRANHGLAPLTLNAQLSNVARAKSQDMRDNKYFAHNSPTYGTPFEMMKSFGITYRTAGENIAMGYSTPEAVVNGWMNSPGHRANILNASFTQIGVGYVASGHYWTQMFIG